MENPDDDGGVSLQGTIASVNIHKIHNKNSLLTGDKNTNTPAVTTVLSIHSAIEEQAETATRSLVNVPAPMESDYYEKHDSDSNLNTDSYAVSNLNELRESTSVLNEKHNFGYEQNNLYNSVLNSRIVTHFTTNFPNTTDMLNQNIKTTDSAIFDENHTLFELSLSNHTGYGITYETEQAFELPHTIKIIISCILSVIILCAIIGNLLVCVAIFTERSLRKTSNFFYVSLALADLLVATVVMTFAVANDMMGHWVFGPVFCDIWLSADVMCSTASILNICAISLDRFLHIKDPYHYESTMTSRRTLLFIGVIWLLSGLISFLPIHLDLHKTESYDPYLGDLFICVLDLNPVYAVCSSIVSFFVPCVIMIAIYIKLYQYAQKHVKDIKRTSTWSAQSAAMLDPKCSQYRASDHKAAVTLGVIMGTFLFCWMPFFTINVTGAFCACVPPLLFNALTWLGYLNSMANPIIYPVFNKDFRTAFRRILFHPTCCNIPCSNCTTKDVNKNARSLSNSSSFSCTKFQYKSAYINGHSRSFDTQATFVLDRSDYTLNTSRSMNHSDGFNIDTKRSISNADGFIKKENEMAVESRRLITAPDCPLTNTVDKITVV